MVRLLIALLSLCLLAGTASAKCPGTDLRAGLGAQDRAELQRLSDEAPFSLGNHWRATRGGQVLHLVGTVHVNDPRLAPVLDRLRPLIEQAQTVVVEVTPAEEAELQRAVIANPGAVFIMSGPTLPELLDEAEWQAVMEEARARGLPPFMAAKLQPWYLSLTLALPPCVVQDVTAGELGLDHQIMAVANANGVPLMPLDAPDALVALMGEDPIEEQLRALRLWLPMRGMADDLIVTTLASYFEERPVEVTEINRILARTHGPYAPDEVDALFDGAFDALLDRRNRAWVEKITALPDGLSVVAVGAAHLPGRIGLLNLLAEQGYRLERQPF